MTYKTIVASLGENTQRTQHLDLAAGLAEEFDAHFVGLFAFGLARIASYAIAEGPMLYELEERRRQELSQEVQKVFQERTRRRAALNAEFRESGDDELRALVVNARYADLLVLPQPEEGGGALGLAGDVVLAAGRPVLYVPNYGRFPQAGNRVLVAWNASREATRAVTDALPLLRRAAHVEVVAFDPDRSGADHGEAPGADVSLYLARHGVKATASRQYAPDIDVGAQILSRAADMDADLIVMGAYGHSRMRELVLGGATRAVLQTMTVPVLMSH